MAGDRDSEIAVVCHGEKFVIQLRKTLGKAHLKTEEQTEEQDFSFDLWAQLAESTTKSIEVLNLHSFGVPSTNIKTIDGFKYKHIKFESPDQKVTWRASPPGVLCNFPLQFLEQSGEKRAQLPAFLYK
jgi:hypothetical protein